MDPTTDTAPETTSAADPSHPLHGLNPTQFAYFNEQAQALQALQAQLVQTQAQANEAIQSAAALIAANNEPANEHARPQARAPHGHNTTNIKMKTPDTFGGQRTKLRSFVIQMRIYL